MSKFYVKVARSGLAVQTVWLTIPDAADPVDAQNKAEARIDSDPENFNWDMQATEFENYDYKVEKADD